jgi:DHA1 family bicyclomycin/chloramphenicol resistance-like MFS transporter
VAQVCAAVADDPLTPAHPGGIKQAVVLGALSAFGPMCTDMYLPAFPMISRQFSVSDPVVQLTVTTCLLGLALGQLIAGPVSDRLGRRSPLLVGLAIFAGASVACAVAPDAYVLLAARLAQGLAGAAGLVIGRAIVRDLYSGWQMARYFATLMLVMGIAPIAAPLAGSGILEAASWHAIFWVLACFGALLLIAVRLWLPETLPPAGRRGNSRAAGLLLASLRDKRFVGLALTSGLVSGAMFAYIGGATFVLQQVYRLSPLQFGLVFGSNAIGIVVASQLSTHLVERVTPLVLLWAGVLQAAAGGVVLLCAATAHLVLPVVLVGLFCVVSTIGLVSPNASALALEDQAGAAGSAAAMLGLSQLAIGALIAPIVGAFGGTLLPLAIAMAASAWAAVAAMSYLVAAPLHSGPCVTGTMNRCEGSK